MNQRRPGSATLNRLLCNWPAALMGSMALAGVAAAAQDGSAIAATAATSPASTLYRVTNLGPGEAGVFINAKGQATFTHFPPWWSDEPPHAWFYDGAHLHEIGTLGGSDIRTNGLNDLGTVTGISGTAAGLIHSFVWNLHRGMTDIGTLPGRNGAWDPVINNRGVVAGYSTVDPSPPWPRAFRWSASSGMEDLGLLLPGEESPLRFLARHAFGGRDRLQRLLVHRRVARPRADRIARDSMRHGFECFVEPAERGMDVADLIDQFDDIGGRAR